MPQGHPASYSISLDSVPRTDFIINASNPVDPVDDVLASFSNLNYGAHELELTVHNPDNVNDLTFLMMFDRAIIESRLPPVPNTNASR